MPSVSGKLCGNEDSENQHENLFRRFKMARLSHFFTQVTVFGCHSSPMVQRSLRVRQVPGSNPCEVQLLNNCLEGYRSSNETLKNIL